MKAVMLGAACAILFSVNGAFAGPAAVTGLKGEQLSAPIVAAHYTGWHHHHRPARRAYHHYRYHHHHHHHHHGHHHHW